MMKDLVKSDLNVLGNFLILTTTTIFAIVGYGATHLDSKVSTKVVVVGLVLLGILCVILLILSIAYYKSREKLKELESA